ncbi:MAG: ATP-binding protein [Burkholderiaceae bacterium]
MRKFLDLPIRTKLLSIILLSSGAALILSMISIVIYDSLEYTDQRIRELNTQAEVFGQINTAALTFNDPLSATESLSALKLRPQITAAALYRPDGKLFATYFRKGIHYAFPPMQNTSYRIRNDDIDVFYKIQKNAETIGTIYLHANLNSASRAIHIIGLLAIVMMASLGFSLWISDKLQNIISTPLLEMSAIANDVVNKKDYALRTKKYNADEIGMLAEAFNQMLSRIQERDANLMMSNLSLQKEIDARKQAQESLKKNLQELARSNAELEQFAYVSSHDLQEPLRMIASYSQLIEKRYIDKLDTKGLTFLGYIVEGAKRMQELIDDLLMFSRVGTHGKEMGPISVKKPIDIAIHSLVHLINETKAQISYPDSLPTIIGDTTQLAQLFQNLIANAIKFSGKNIPRIEINAIKLNDFWEFTVKDYGIGIEREHFDRIFVIFQRLHGRSEYPGSGIGLAICKKIVERHGGHIWVESVVGTGTTFHFTLREAA